MLIDRIDNDLQYRCHRHVRRQLHVRCQLP